MELPAHWTAVDDGLLGACRDRAVAALGGDGLLAHLDPDGEHAGTLFSTIPDDDPHRVTPADLLAVGTVSPQLPLPVVRALLEDAATAERTTALLRRVPTDVAMADPPGADVLLALEELDTALRRLPDGRANRWVLAAKLAARKRPDLAPLRDRVVCCALAGTADLRTSPLGPYAVDLQVFAHLVRDDAVRARPAEQRERLEQAYGDPVRAVPDLRLLDVALWLAGSAAGYAGRARR